MTYKTYSLIAEFYMLTSIFLLRDKYSIEHYAYFARTKSLFLIRGCIKFYQNAQLADENSTL